MKILQVVPSIAPRFGGPSVAIVGLIRALERWGIDTTLFTTNANGNERWDVPLGRVVGHNGARVVYYNSWPKTRYAFSIDLAMALEREIHNFDLVHIHWLYNFSSLLAAVICARHRVPYVFQPNGSLDPYLTKKNYLIKRLYLSLPGGFVLSHAAANVFTTAAEKRLASGFNRSAPSFVVPVGIDLTEYEQLPERGEFREKFPETRDKRIVLFLGRVCRQKGLDLLIKAFRRVVAVHDDVQLMIVGPEEEGYGERVRRWVSEESLAQHVTFVGPVDHWQKLAAYVDGDVYVLPSYAENFGATVAEALACKRPVVISDQVNICDEITSAEAGIVVGCSAESIAGGISRVLGDQNLARRLGENGYELVKQKYTWEAAVRQLIPIYRELAAISAGRQ